MSIPGQARAVSATHHNLLGVSFRVVVKPFRVDSVGAKFIQKGLMRHDIGAF